MERPTRISAMARRNCFQLVLNRFNALRRKFQIAEDSFTKGLRAGREEEFGLGEVPSIDCRVNSRKYCRLIWEPRLDLRGVPANQKRRGVRNFLLWSAGRERRRTWFLSAGWDSKCDYVVCLVSSCLFKRICGTSLGCRKLGSNSTLICFLSRDHHFS